MKHYRLMLSCNGGLTYYHHSSHDTPQAAHKAAVDIPDKDYQVIDCRNNHVVMSGQTRPSRAHHSRGWLNYERK